MAYASYSSNQLQSFAQSKSQNVTSPIITSIYAKESITPEAQSLPIQINGDTNAVYSMTITRSSDGRSYNFTSKTFASTVTSESRLKNQAPGVVEVSIPAAASGNTYTINIFAEPHYNTFMYRNNNVFDKLTVTQKANAQITFTAKGVSHDNTSLGSSTGTITKIYSGINTNVVEFKRLQLTSDSSGDDIHGFFLKDTDGTILTRGGVNATSNKFFSAYFYWQTGNYVANGAGSNSSSLTLTSVDGLIIGMQVGTINGTDRTFGLKSITAINTDTKTVTLDGNESWSDTHVILFRAYGADLINTAVGIKLQLEDTLVELGETTTTLRSAITSNIASGSSIDVNGTTGISAGTVIKMKGLEKSTDSGAATIGNITASTTQGEIQILNARIPGATRTVRAKTKITVIGSSEKVFLTGKIKISKYPAANQVIYLDTVKLLQVGSAAP
jgi:hypothetical protein